MKVLPIRHLAKAPKTVVALALVSCLFLLFPSLMVQAQSHSTNSVAKILILNSYHDNLLWTENIMTGLRAELDASNMKAEVHVEYMDTKRHQPDIIFPLLEKLYRSKYKATQFDLIITTDDNALNFLRPRRQWLLPGVPVVFCGVNNYTPSLIEGLNNITGVAEAADLVSTIEMALLIQPDTHHIAVVNDMTTTGIANEKLFRKAALKFADRVEFIELFNLSADELTIALNKLPGNCAVLMLSFYQDRAGENFSAHDFTKLITENCNVPVYTAWDFFLGLGIAGGVMTNGQAQGKHAARLAIRVLNGEPANQIPVLRESPNLPMLDYSVMKQFGLSTAKIPADIIIINKPESCTHDHTLEISIALCFSMLQFLMILALAVNILRRKRAETRINYLNDKLAQVVAERTSKLHESENKYRTMMEAMQDPIYICSADFRVEYMNPAMIKRTGRDASGDLCYKVLHDLDQPCPWCKGKGEINDKQFEADVVSPKDNHSYHISHSPLLKEDGSVSNMIVFRDTTEFKKLENQLIQSQKMEAIGQLAGGVAHDFNNILTSILGYSEMVSDELKEGSNLWEDVQEIKQSGVRAANLTRQLLAFSRKQKIIPKAVNINDLIKDMKKMLGRLIDEDIRLEISLDDEVGKIYADPGQLEQIALNLIVNARDALKSCTEITDKTITVSTSEVYLDNDYVPLHEGSSPGWHLFAEVSDNGCGMSKDVLNHIFEPFYTTKATGQGTGMGLATVYGIVKQNNASIYVYSEPGLGTTFKIYWPIMQEKDENINEKEKISELESCGDEVILLVEDDNKIRKVMSRRLRQKGYKIIEAINGQEALKKANDCQGVIDLLFTDVVMPVMGGKELSEKIIEPYPDIALLFTSGYFDDNIHEDILGKGEFISKPYNIYEVLQRIRQLLDKTEP